MKILFPGALSPLAEEQLTKQDLLLLEIVRFLCISVTTVQVQTLSFRASDIRRRLLMLTEASVFDSTKPLHLHMVSMRGFYSRPTSVNVLLSNLHILLVFLLSSVPWEVLKWLHLVFLKCIVVRKTAVQICKPENKELRKILILPL